MNTFTRCQWCPLDQYLSSKYIYAALTLTFGNFYWSGEQSLDSWHDEPSSWVGRYIHQLKNYSHWLHPPTIFWGRRMHPPTLIFELVHASTDQKNIDFQNTSKFSLLQIPAANSILDFCQLQHSLAELLL